MNKLFYLLLIPIVIAIAAYFIIDHLDDEYEHIKEAISIASRTSAYNFHVMNASHQPYDLAVRRGKPTLFVNVASKCGFTFSGYTAAQELYDKYKHRGFEVIAFPCNQFRGQEPGSEEEIVGFCTKTYKVSFPVMAKVDVNGVNASDLWKWLKFHGPPNWVGGRFVMWNFAAFLVDGEGKVVARFWPLSVAAVESALLPLLEK